MKLSVGVFFGGESVEHEVSVISALQAVASLDKEKYEAVPIYISKNGTLYTGEHLLDIENYRDLPKLLSMSRKAAIARNGEEVHLMELKEKLFGKPVTHKLDVAFPIVHGTNCEDGTAQGYIRLLGLPYVGCDVASSAAGMDKLFTKAILREAGIPVVEGFGCTSVQWADDSNGTLAHAEELLGYPMIVKPANLGSSVGIKKAGDRDELSAAIEYALQFSGKLLIERAIINLREINCSVLGDAEKAEASVCEEPVSSDEILSYQDKYLSGGTSKGMSSLKRRLPADIPPEKAAEIQRYSKRAFAALGCSGVVRIDFILDDEGNVYLNELNTIPGSLAFYLWKASGLSYPQLLDRLISLAFKRQREEHRLKYSYETNILSGKFSFGAKGSKGKL